MTIAELINNARCFKCIPRGMLQSVDVYNAVSWANGGQTPVPQPEVLLGNPDENWVFGDPNTDTAFGYV